MKPSDPLSDQILVALKPVIERLRVLAASDPGLRAELRRLGESLLALAAEPSPAEPTTPTTNASDACSPEIVPAPGAAAAEPPAAPASPRGANARIAPAPSPIKKRAPDVIVNRSQQWSQHQALQLPTNQLSLIPGGAELDLRALAQRCAVKQEGATWAAERQQRLAQGIKFDIEMELRRQKLIEHAQSLSDCYLWMCQREAQSPVEPIMFEHLAGCFEAMMHIVILVEALLADKKEEDTFLEPALNLAAEAQAALRHAATAINGGIDNDQAIFFQWLKIVTNQRQIHIRHYMTKRNSAKPSEWAALKVRIQALANQIQTAQQVNRQRQKLFSKVRHRRTQIEKATGRERLEDWQRLDEAVSSLIESGLPPSNLALREQLLPVLDQLPEALELSKNFQLVLREIDRFLAKRSPAPADMEVSEPIEEVLRVRALLRGQTIVLIGGERRPAAAVALKTAFALQELIWIEGHDQTYMDFEPHVARPEVTVVLLAIRWSRHGFGEVKEFCDRYSKPLVRLPAGYNPNRVAYTILNQIGHRLLQSEA
ncbi:MAG: hypothetical protein R3E79_22165 [Caldilineaceae bacterium]